jgi:hypothetical protein
LYEKILYLFGTQNIEIFKSMLIRDYFQDLLYESINSNNIIYNDNQDSSTEDGEFEKLLHKAARN